MISHASQDPRFASHPGLLKYGIESYIAVPLNRRDGSYFGTLCAFDPLPAELAEEDLEIFQLLSQLIAFELEADEQNQRREAQTRMLEDFIAMAAHDLRQPLTALSVRAQLLARAVRRTPGAEVLAERVDGLIQDIGRATALSETLLDIARIESGGLVIERTGFDLIAMIREVLRDIRALAPRHTLRLDVPDALTINADERRLGRVVRNLLENAIKYSAPDAGPIVVRVDRSGCRDAEMADREVVRLTVRDHGPGVDPNELGAIFDRQYRARNASSQETSGSGLGLFIAREMVSAHHGMITARNAEGGGLEVIVTLPEEVA